MLFGACAVLAACTESGGPQRPRPFAFDGLDDAGPSESSCRATLTRRIRRLSAREYLNVVADIFGAEQSSALATMLPAELSHAGFDNQDSALLVSPVFQEAVAALADTLSRSVDPEALAPCADKRKAEQCLRDYALDLTRKAYGRPADASELARLLEVAELGDGYADSVRLLIETVMQSPYTLYATELGAEDEPKDERVALTQYELASQLSLNVTASRPDRALMEAADQGALSDPALRLEHAQRLLVSARGQEQLRRFVVGWLDLGPLSDVPKNTNAFPQFDQALAQAMQEELDAFIAEKLSLGEGDFSELLCGVSSHIPEALRPIYGDDFLSESEGGGLDPARRSGILSLPAVLTYHSAEHHSGPVERGLFVRRQLLCQEVAAPPASVAQKIAAAPVNVEDPDRTTRQSFEAHLSEDFCRGCHAQFDPIGFGLEEMDGIGRYRTRERNRPVDSHGELSGTDVDGPFEGAAQLSLRLSESDMVRECLSQHFFRFVAARPPALEERCLTSDWADRFAQGGQRMRELWEAYVGSAEFARRLEDRR